MWINRDSCSYHFHFSFPAFHSAPSILCVPSPFCLPNPLIYISYSLALSSSCRTVLCMKKKLSTWNKYIAAITPASKRCSASGAFPSARTGDGYKKCAEYTWQGCCSQCQSYGRRRPLCGHSAGAQQAAGPGSFPAEPPVPSREQDAATARWYQACACETATSRNRSASRYPKADIICMYRYSGPCLSPAAT